MSDHYQGQAGLSALSYGHVFQNIQETSDEFHLD